jgi:excisionase family DNA binding protein
MKLFTVQEASEILGVKEKTIRDWIWKKRIETVRNGRRYVRISEAAIQHFIEVNTVPADLNHAVKKRANSFGRSEPSHAQRQ